MEGLGGGCVVECLGGADRPPLISILHVSAHTHAVRSSASKQFSLVMICVNIVVQTLYKIIMTLSNLLSFPSFILQSPILSLVITVFYNASLLTRQKFTVFLGFKNGVRMTLLAGNFPTSATLFCEIIFQYYTLYYHFTVKMY